jgi:hypothetical protein
MGDPVSNRAVARDQRFADWTMSEHRVDENRAGHSRDHRAIDREDAMPARDAVKSAEFAKEGPCFDVVRHKVPRDSVRRRPATDRRDKINVAVAGRPANDPGACRRLEPNAMAIKNPTGFWIERFETGVCRK